MQAFDAISVGGGPAGTAFGITLARSGRKVLIVEKSPAARHKVCGEFLSEDSIGLLRNLGLHIDKLGASPSTHLRLASGSKDIVRRLPFQAAGLSRHAMDEALLDLAANAGASVIRGVSVHSLKMQNHGVIVEAGKKQFIAPRLIVATGKYRIKPIQYPLGANVSFKMMLELSASSHHAVGNEVIMSAYDNGYQGLQIVENQMASLCWTVERSVAACLSNDWEAHQAFLSEKSTLAGDLLAAALPMWPKPLSISGTPFGYLRPAEKERRLVYAGDQLATVPPICGDGMAIALASGTKAARALMSEDDIVYHHEMHRALKQRFMLARSVHALATRSRMHGAAMKVLQTCPRIITIFANATRFPVRQLGLVGKPAMPDPA